MRQHCCHFTCHSVSMSVRRALSVTAWLGAIVKDCGSLVLGGRRPQPCGWMCGSVCVCSGGLEQAVDTVRARHGGGCARSRVRAGVGGHGTDLSLRSDNLLAMWNCRCILLQLFVSVDRRETVTSARHEASAPEAGAHAGARCAMQTPGAARSNPSRGMGRKAARAAPRILLKNARRRGSLRLL